MELGDPPIDAHDVADLLSAPHPREQEAGVVLGWGLEKSLPTRVSALLFEADLVDVEVGVEVHRRPRDRQIHPAPPSFAAVLVPGAIANRPAVDRVGLSVKLQLADAVHELLAASGLHALVEILARQHRRPSAEGADRRLLELELAAPVLAAVGDPSLPPELGELDLVPLGRPDRVVLDLGPRAAHLVVEMGHVEQLVVVGASGRPSRCPASAGSTACSARTSNSRFPPRGCGTRSSGCGWCGVRTPPAVRSDRCRTCRSRGPGSRAPSPATLTARGWAALVAGLALGLRPSRPRGEPARGHRNSTLTGRRQPPCRSDANS